MNKESLVVLKGKTKVIVERTENSFLPNEKYRAVKQDDNSIIVFGELLDMETFNNLFETVYDRMIREWIENGLFPMCKPLSKKAFVELLDIHTYGRGQGKLFIGFVGNKMDGLFAFQPLFSGDTKAKFINHCYKMYQDTLNEDMTHVDDELLQRGNSGIPLSFGDIYFRKEYNPHNEKREIYC